VSKPKSGNLVVNLFSKTEEFKGKWRKNGKSGTSRLVKVDETTEKTKHTNEYMNDYKGTGAGIRAEISGRGDES
jgi:hypothetical protein